MIKFIVLYVRCIYINLKKVLNQQEALQTEDENAERDMSLKKKYKWRLQNVPMQ